MNIDSTIEELTLFNYQVDVNEPVKSVTKKFKTDSDLPGVTLLKNGKFFGIISQKSFWQYMSLPYSIEISSRRSIDYIYNHLKIPSLILPKTTTIIDAVKKALERPTKILEEPLVVELFTQEYKLLDLHQLLIAQAKIHEIANLLITNLYKDMEKANQKLKLLSSFDGLTQLSNRRIFDEYLQCEWRTAETQPETHIALIIGELDCFKPYNEIYGHLAGDDALRRVAKVIDKALKGVNCLAARYGGDDFAIVLPNKDRIDAACLAEKIRKQILALEIKNSGSEIYPYLTMSFGIASTIPSKGNNKPDMLLIGADRALTQAKRAGKNRKAVWNNYYLQNIVKIS